MRLKGIKKVTRPNGRVELWFRHPGGGFTRLPNLPENDPRFLSAYQAAASGETAKPRTRAEKGTLAALIEAYRSSPTWRALAPSTREVRMRILSSVGIARGAAILTAIQPKHIRADIGAFSPNPARQRLKVWRSLMSFAVETGLIEENPAAAVKPPKAKTDGHRLWAMSEIAAFRSAHAIGTDRRLAFEVAYWTGCRRADLMRLGWQHVGADGWLTYRQQKTGGEVMIPFSCDLPDECAAFADDHAILRQALAATPPGRMLFVETRDGRQRSVKAFGAWFSLGVRAAGLSGVSLHGLRKSRLTAGAEARWSAHQLAAWVGHKSLSETQRYTMAAQARAVLGGTEQKRKTGTTSDPRSISGAKALK